MKEALAVSVEKSWRAEDTGFISLAIEGGKYRF